MLYDVNTACYRKPTDSLVFVTAIKKILVEKFTNLSNFKVIKPAIILIISGWVQYFLCCHSAPFTF